MKYTKNTILKHRKQWLDTLESGKLKQARGVLVKTQQRTGEPIGYCCLGVAASLAKVPCENVKGDASNNYAGGTLHFVDDDGYSDGFVQSELLPTGAMEWLGLADNDPFIALPHNHPRYQTTLGSLASLNDRGATFEEIAGLIREYGFIDRHDELKQ